MRSAPERTTVAPQQSWKSAAFRYSLPLLTMLAALLVQGAIQFFLPKGTDFPFAFFYLIAAFLSAWYGGYVPGALSCLLIAVGLPLASGGWHAVDISRVSIFVAISLTISRTALTQRRAREALSVTNDELDRRVQARTCELQTEIEERSKTESALRASEDRLRTQLEQLSLLDQITRAIGERQDLLSVCQAVIRSVEDSLPVDFGCVCLYDAVDQVLTVNSVGVRSEALGLDLAMPAHARINVDENGLSRCLRGQLVYERDLSQVAFPLPQKLARAGLLAMVAAPLLVESQVFGVFIAARRAPDSFSSTECEFLRQLSEHAALAANQAQIYSALQQAYQDLRQTQQTVMQQERLRALGQMASGIAHDINNAISPIALYTEALLESEPHLSQRARRYLEISQRAIEDVAQTVARMREFYRREEPHPALAPVDLGRLAQQVVDLTRARWSDMPQQRGFTIHLHLELAPRLPPIAGVESEVREALTNLIFNALDAMPEGGTLTLRTRAAAGQERPTEKQVEIEVADTGAGMDEDTRRRCLEPFFTTKGERGTGLGLAMVYGIVQRHNARLDIESTPGMGTTVRLIFPQAAVVDGGVRSESPTAIPGRLRILVVDDDPLLIRSLRDSLESDGHTVTTANGGQEGIDVFTASEQAGGRFSVVITDLGMPNVDGRKVASAVKGVAPSMPVILLTGWGQRLEVEGGAPPHVDRMLSKPPRLRDLRAALAELTCSDANLIAAQGAGK